jgi:DNA-binding response OmpR family regulator
MDILNTSPIDLIITDIRLDGQNGLHLIAMSPQPVPAIVVTGFDDAGIAADARRLGADYLVKPVAASVLKAAVARKLADAAEKGVFREARREPRRAVTRSPAARLDRHHTRVLDVSRHGARLEVRVAASDDLPPSTVLRFTEPPLEVPVAIVWKQPTLDGMWLCGAAIMDPAGVQWEALVDMA